MFKTFPLIHSQDKSRIYFSKQTFSSSSVNVSHFQNKPLMFFFFTHAIMAGNYLKDSWQRRTIYIWAKTAPTVSLPFIWFPCSTALIYCLFRPHSLERIGIWLHGLLCVHIWRFNRVSEDFWSSFDKMLNPVIIPLELVTTLQTPLLALLVL